MSPTPTPAALPDQFDVTLRYVRDNKLPLDAPRPQPTRCWPRENIALYERYRAWLISGGFSETTSKSIYLPVAGFILGLNLKPHPQINLQQDLQKVQDYYIAREMSPESLNNCRHGLNLFRRFLRLERGLGEEVHLKPFDPAVYCAGLPTWLLSELQRFQHIQQRNWRETRFNQNLHGFWNKLCLVWRFLCQERGVRQLAELKRKYILDYIDQRLALKYSVATINAELRMFHSFLLFLQDEGCSIPDTIVHFPNLKQPDPLPKFLTDEQVRMLREEAERNVRDAVLPSHLRQAILVRAIFYLLWQGGMRLAEVEDLRLEDLDLEGRSLMVRSSKNLKDRTVYLTETVILVLREYLDVRGNGYGSPEVFLFRNAPLKKGLIHSQMQMLGDRVGVHVHCHRLRHTCATQLLNAGCRITSIQRFLGHKKLNTTMIYARAHDQTVAEDYFAAMNRVEQRLDIIPLRDIIPLLDIIPEPKAEIKTEIPYEVVNVQERKQLLAWVDLLSLPELPQADRLSIVAEMRRELVGRLSPPVQMPIRDVMRVLEEASP